MGKEKKNTYEYVKSKIEERNYKLIDKEYINNNTKLHLKCPKGHDYYTTFTNFGIGSECKLCSNEKRRQKSFKELLILVDKIGYEYIEDDKYIFNTKKDKIHLKCNKGHDCYMSFDKLKQNRRCSKCKRSKGEELISKYLDKNNIKYISQYTFEDCKYQHVLPFDFYLEDFNLLIEFDGEQHFSPRFGDNSEEFEKTKIRDGIKNDYCLKNNIKLLRIPYTKIKEIDSILNKNLKQE